MSSQPAGVEIDIDEAARISGRSKRTLMRYAKADKLSVRVEKRAHIQRQKRMLFRRDEIEALKGTNEG